MKCRLMGALTALWVAGCASAHSQIEPAPVASDTFEKTDATAVGAATIAKEVCSAVFVSGFDANQHLSTNAKFWLSNEDRTSIEDVTVDRDAREVTLSVRGIPAGASFIGERGCVAWGPNLGRPDLAYRELTPAALNLDEDWPLGDRLPETRAESPLTPDLIEAAMRLAFADEAYTGAVIIIHKGQIVGEQYGRGVTPTTRLPGWSIAKSLQATLVGRLEHQGAVDLFSPVNIEAWSADGDSRGQTTLADLLRMSAPVSCGNTQSWHDQDAWPTTGYPESFYVFSGPADAYAYSIARPPLGQEEPRGVYTNCQPMIVGQVLQNVLSQYGSDLEAYAESALYQPLGMNRVVIEPDRVGNPLTAGYALATARDWARLGLLYANEGVWNGERLLSLEFMSFVRAPAPHWDDAIYGGQVWLNAEACLFDQCDAYQFNGIEGQRVVIFPSLDLVVARFGFGAGDIPNPDPSARRPAIEALNASMEVLVDALNTDPDLDTQAVLETLETFFQSMSNDNRVRYDSVLTNDFRLLEAGEVWSSDYTWQRAARPNREEEWTLTQPRITVSGDVAFAEYRNTGHFTSADDRQVYEWLESAVLVRNGEAWQIKLLHSTPVPQIRE